MQEGYKESICAGISLALRYRSEEQHCSAAILSELIIASLQNSIEDDIDTTIANTINVNGDSKMSEIGITETDMLQKTNTILADSLYDLKEYSRSEYYYGKAKQFDNEEVGNNPQFDKISFKKAMCCEERHHFDEAIKTLENMTNHSSMTLVHLGRLKRSSGIESAFRQALQMDSLNLEAALALGDWASFPSEFGIPSEKEDTLKSLNMIVEWMKRIVRGRSKLTLGDYKTALDEFNLLSEELRQNPSGNPRYICPFVALNQAICCCCMNAIPQAVLFFDAVREQDMYYADGMDIYASLLLKQRMKEKLYMLAFDMKKYNPMRAETFLVMIEIRRFELAVCDDKCDERMINLAQRALDIDPNHSYAHLLKSQVYVDANMHATGREEVLKARRNRYAGTGTGKNSSFLSYYPFNLVYGEKLLVECNIEANSISDAMTVAMAAITRDANSLHALCLYATVLIRDSVAAEYTKARQVLEKALKIDCENIEASLLLAELHSIEGSHDTAIGILNELLNRANTAEVHCGLGDAHQRAGDKDSAISEYTLCLMMNSRCLPAWNNLQDLRRRMDEEFGEVTVLSNDAEPVETFESDSSLDNEFVAL